MLFNRILNQIKIITLKIRNIAIQDNHNTTMNNAIKIRKPADIAINERDKKFRPISALFFKLNHKTGLFEVERIEYRRNRTKRTNSVFCVIRHLETNQLLSINKKWFDILFEEALLDESAIRLIDQSKKAH